MHSVFSDESVVKGQEKNHKLEPPSATFPIRSGVQEDQMPSSKISNTQQTAVFPDPVGAAYISNLTTLSILVIHLLLQESVGLLPLDNRSDAYPLLPFFRNTPIPQALLL